MLGLGGTSGDGRAEGTCYVNLNLDQTFSCIMVIWGGWWKPSHLLGTCDFSLGLDAAPLLLGQASLLCPVPLRPLPAPLPLLPLASLLHTGSGEGGCAAPHCKVAKLRRIFTPEFGQGMD